MRRTPLKRRAPMKRGKPIRKRNPERAAMRYERDYGGPYADWIRSLACCVSGSGGCEDDPIVAAHAKSRGAGGTAKDLVPMRQSLHAEQHMVGMETFERRYRVDLQAIADAHWLRWKAFAGPIATDEAA